MFMKRFLKITAVFLFMLSVSGCGDAGNTNGTLALSTVVTDLGGGRSFIKATATVSKAVSGIPITFTGKHSKLDGTLLINPPINAKVNTDSTGRAEMQFYADQQAAETYFEVTATVDGGGLFKADTVTIPVKP